MTQSPINFSSTDQERDALAQEQNLKVSQKPQISYDHFSQLDLRSAQITQVQEIPGADKLLKLTLDAGELGERVIVSGLKIWYNADSLIGKQIIFLANLEPRTLRGIESQGMLIAINSDRPVLVIPEKEVKPGSTLS